MKTLGYILITVGFLAGSLVAVETPENAVNPVWFVPALLLGAIGVALARLGVKAETQHEGRTSADVEALGTSIARIVDNVRQLDGQKTEMHPFDVHGRIDELFLDDLATFVEARESIGHVYGLQAYAEVMNEFAAGERYLNRVWSASVDCWIDEVHAYIPRAREQFEQTQSKLTALTRQGSQRPAES